MFGIGLLVASAAILIGPLPRDKDLLTVLTTTAVDDWRHESDYFRALARLAERNKLSPNSFQISDPGERAAAGRWRANMVNGRAELTGTGVGRRVLVLLDSGEPRSIPDSSSRQFVLFDLMSKLTGRLICGINSRYGDLKVDLPTTPAADGATVVVRFESRWKKGEPWHNWHTISLDGKPYTFRAEERNDPTGWYEKGLLRAKVENGRFVVLFPELKQTDGGK